MRIHRESARMCWGAGVGRRYRPTIVSAILLSTAVLFGACAAATGSGGNPFEGGAAGEEMVRVTVQNRNYRDATVWAHWNGSRNRVGRVTGNSTQTFEMRHRSDRVQFEIDFLAGGGYMGRSISVSPGDHLQLTIRP